MKILLCLFRALKNSPDVSKSAILLLQNHLCTVYHEFQPHKFDYTEEMSRKSRKLAKKCLKNAIMLIQGPQKPPYILKSAILLLQSHLCTVFH